MDRLASLNQDCSAQLRKEIDDLLTQDPGADLGSLLLNYARKYTQRRDRRITALKKRNKSRVAHTTVHEVVPESTDEVQVLFQLQPELERILDRTDVTSSDSSTADQLIFNKIEAAVKAGHRLQENTHNVVTRVADTIVVKTIPGSDTTEICALRHIREHTNRIPVPVLLGAVSSGKQTHIVMSFIQGISLQDIWRELSADQKLALKGQMEDILSELRGLRLPSRYFGGGEPPSCRDIRMDNRQSTPYVANEEEFNAFILSDPRKKLSQTYLDFIRKEVLTTDHRVVMTHGDFTRRNLIVERSNDGSITIVGVIDWEGSGVYPDYWEYVKMLNTVSAIEDDDWLQYLPQVLSKDAGAEWAKQLLIDRITR